MAFFYSSPSLAIHHYLRLQPLCLPIRQKIHTSGSPIPSPRSMCSICHSSSSQSNSWVPVVKPDDGLGGWFVVPPQESPVRTGGQKLFVAGVGASVVVLLVSLVHFSLSQKGFGFQLIPLFQPLVEIFSSQPANTLREETMIDTKEAVDTIIEEKPLVGQSISDQVKDGLNSGEKGYKMVPVAADSTQQQAMSLLKELKVIEDDAKPYELCTRREYARWLVKTNSLLERDPKHRIVPDILIAVSTKTAFDDVSSSDPDFMFIQAIGESGILPSRLSIINHQELGDISHSNPTELYLFSPESLISRLDLIIWKAKLEYPLVPGADEKMLRNGINFMDLGTVSADVLQELFMDTLAGERSILRRVFGNIRRLQPHKPVTKAQAAVALTSGRMVDAVQIEISRIEAEKISKSVDSKEILTELINKGDIQKFWEQKLNEEKVRGSDIQKELLALTQTLEEEKLAYHKEIADHIKEKATLDCQWQLLSSLKDEVDRMTERIVNDKSTIAAEQSSLEELLGKLNEELNATFETKSILEAEKEALRILRTWVEDGARRSQFRAKILEDAVQRWKWDGPPGLPKAT